MNFDCLPKQWSGQNIFSHLENVMGRIRRPVYGPPMGRVIFEKSVAMLLLLAFVMSATTSVASMRNAFVGDGGYSEPAMAKQMALLMNMDGVENSPKPMVGCPYANHCLTSMAVSSMCGSCALGSITEIKAPDGSMIQIVQTAFVAMSDKATLFSLLKPPRI